MEISIPSNVPKSKDWFVVRDSDYVRFQQSHDNDNDIRNDNDNDKDNNNNLVLSKKITPIDATQLEFEKVIGNGSFGQVWKGKWRLTQVAIKQIKQNIINEKSKISILQK